MRESRAAYNKSYYEAHKEEIAARNKRWQEAHKESVAIKAKTYYEAHKEERKVHYEAHKEERKAYRELRKEDIAAQKKVYYIDNKKRCDTSNKAYREANKEKRGVYNKRRQKEKRQTRLLYEYGLQPGEYDTMLAAQGGVCAICGKPPTTRVLHVDHSHKTNRVRKLLCGKCNSLLGFCDDNAAILSEAIKYLREQA